MDTGYSNTIIDLIGSVEIYSELELEDLGKIISEEIFGNIPFVGLLNYVYEEVPTIFIERGSLLGLDVKLFGYKSSAENGRYFLQIMSGNQLGFKYPVRRIHFSFTLFQILSSKLKKYNNIKVVQDYAEFGDDF
jgi:hypothetical protein